MPALEFSRVIRKIAKKKIDLERERNALKTADDNLSRLLSEEKPAVQLGGFIGDYLRVHLMNEFPLTERNAALAALQKYQGKISSQTTSTGIAQSGDFGYSYGIYAAKDVNGSEKNNFSETGSFARVWRRDDKGKWKLILIVMHAAPPAKRTEQ
jgi:hypothetical protein